MSEEDIDSPHGELAWKAVNQADHDLSEAIFNLQLAVAKLYKIAAFNELAVDSDKIDADDREEYLDNTENLYKQLGIETKEDEE